MADRKIAIRDTAAQFLTAPLRIDSYKRFAYLLLSAPLGLAYFVGVVTGTSLGLGLVVTWVGLPILLATLLGTTLLAGVEARLSRVLLDRPVSDPRAVTRVRETVSAPEGGYLSALRAYLTEPTTWSSLAVVLSKPVFGLVAFVATVTGAATVAALLAAPFVYDSPVGAYQVAGHPITTLPAALVVAGLGLVGLVVTVNLWNALAAAYGRLLERLFSVGSRSKQRPA